MYGYGCCPACNGSGVVLGGVREEEEKGERKRAPPRPSMKLREQCVPYVNSDYCLTPVGALRARCQKPLSMDCYGPFAEGELKGMKSERARKLRRDKIAQVAQMSDEGFYRKRLADAYAKTIRALAKKKKVKVVGDLKNLLAQDMAQINVDGQNPGEARRLLLGQGIYY